ncbi:serine hydrolase domain-containing protein [Metabacillus malikii]|uniref:CubicO group peptidase (Beta-lactamase class C family) n=1 Tax=Metabacillus malikii TaxID=1504265 RepID=A0ABT9ZJU7_9BACI|nr:serine hydrolase domain-containing protein [Metabacillus malikii]MDQ0232561.1 CubicO group peptidase (beta-lactamase class C family) [Metabacillus malikii]
MNGLADRLDPLLSNIIKNGPPGCACLVTYQGKTVYENYLGLSDIETKKQITPNTIYRLFSLTKIVTCVAALILYERGKFLLNDPLEEYLPEFKNLKVFKETNGKVYTVPSSKKLTIKDLFTMTSGITYPGVGNETERMTESVMKGIQNRIDNGQKISLRDISREIAEVPLAFEPGTEWQYGLSHDILGVLIEEISGKRLGQFMEDEIFQPLSMSDTFFTVPKDKIERIASVYSIDADGVLSTGVNTVGPIRINQPYESGGAGLYSTLHDYSQFAQMLANGGSLNGVRIIGRKTIELMAQNHLTVENNKNYNWDYLKGYGYGLGVRVMEDLALGGINSSKGEFGWSGILGTWALIDPKERVSAVYMQQLFPNFEAHYQPRLRAVIYSSIP